MEKNIILILLFIILLISLLGGSSKGDDQVSYIDGQYEAIGELTSEGYEKAIVWIKDNEIVDLELTRHEVDGNEVDYDDWSADNSEGRPNLKDIKDQFAAEILKEQSADIDTIAGATISTKNWKLAVKKALEEAKK